MNITTNNQKKKYIRQKQNTEMNISDKSAEKNKHIRQKQNNEHIRQKHNNEHIRQKQNRNKHFRQKQNRTAKEHIRQINRMGKSISDKHRTMNISDRNKN